MFSFMSLQCSLIHEQFIALITSIWLFSCMNSFVCLQAWRLCEGHLTVITFVRFFTCVHSLVSFELRVAIKNFATVSTLQDSHCFGLSSVFLTVLSQRAWLGVAGTADVTNVWLLSCVPAAMTSQMCRLHKGCATVLALVRFYTKVPAPMCV